MIAEYFQIFTAMWGSVALILLAMMLGTAIGSWFSKGAGAAVGLLLGLMLSVPAVGMLMERLWP